MRLVKHKRRVLTWSLALWPVYLAGLLGIAPYIVPFLDGWLPRWALVLILALSPFGWPLVVGGVVKGIYDVLLLAMFARVRPPEETPVTSSL